jgi:hypothetical protein
MRVHRECTGLLVLSWAGVALSHVTHPYPPSLGRLLCVRLGAGTVPGRGCRERSPGLPRLRPPERRPTGMARAMDDSRFTGLVIMKAAVNGRLPTNARLVDCSRRGSRCISGPRARPWSLATGSWSGPTAWRWASRPTAPTTMLRFALATDAMWVVGGHAENGAYIPNLFQPLPPRPLTRRTRPSTRQPTALRAYARYGRHVAPRSSCAASGLHPACTHNTTHIYCEAGGDRLYLEQQALLVRGLAPAHRPGGLHGGGPAQAPCTGPQLCMRCTLLTAVYYGPSARPRCCAPRPLNTVLTHPCSL